MFYEKEEKEEYREEAVLYIDNRQGEYLAYLEWKEQQENDESESSGEVVLQM